MPNHYFFAILGLFFLFTRFGRTQTESKLQILKPSYYQELSRENTSAVNCFFDLVWGEDGRVWFNPCYNANLLLSSHLVQFDGYELTPVNLEDQSQLLTTGSMLCGLTREGNILGYTMAGKKDYVFTINPDDQKAKYHDLSDVPINSLKIRNVIQGRDGTIFVLVSGKRSLHLLSIANDDIIQLTEAALNRPISYGPIARKLPLFETEAGIWFMDDLLPLFLYKPRTKTTVKYTAASFLPSDPRRISDKVIKGNRRRTRILTYRNELILFLPQYRPFLFSIDEKSEIIKPWKDFPSEWVGYDLYQDKAGNLLTLFINGKNRLQAILRDTSGRQFDYSSFVEDQENHVSRIVGEIFFQQVFIFSKSGLFSAGVKRLNGIQSIALPIPRGLAGALFNNHFFAYHKINEPVIIHPDGYIEANTPAAIPAAACFLNMLNASRNLIRNIIIDDTGVHWFNHSEGVGAYDPASEKCEIYPADGRVVRLAKLNEHTLIGLPQKGAPFLFDKKNKQTVDVQWDLSEQSFNTHLHVSPDSTLWITTSAGLWKLDLRNQKNEIFGFEGDFSDFRFQAIEEDRQGRLWLGTATKGLQIYDRHSGSVKVIDQKQGLAADAVMCLIQDDENVMWAGTRNGLSLVSPEGVIIANVTREDGLPDNQFALYGAKKAPNGKLLFQTESGLALIEPQQLKKELLGPQKINKIFLTSLSYFDARTRREISRGGAVHSIGSIQLSPAHRYLKISMGLSNYVNPKDNVYAYKLEGIDEEWTHIGAQHKLNLSRLPAGKYRLLVKGADYRNNWTPEPLAIPIHAREFFYKQAWFYTFILGLVGLLAFFWIRRLRLEKVRLEAEVHRRTRQIRQDKEVIEQQARELRQLDELKSRFFTNISHELRTPITLITAPIEQLLRKSSQKMEQRFKNSLRMALNNGRNLLNLVEELLDLSRLEAGKLQLDETPTLLQTFCRQLFSAFESRAAMNNIQYNFVSDLDAESPYWIDRKRLEKIVNNLLSNALKFTPDGGKVTLSLRRVRHSIKIQVGDTGRGIPPEDLPHVFERYFQTKRKDVATEGGTGIGLALSKELAKLMKGDLSVKSEWGRGSVFTLTIPAQIASDEEKKVAPEKASAPTNKQERSIILPLTESSAVKTQKPNILVVEDNPDMQQLTRSLLDDQYNCQIANNGAEAWDWLNNGQIQTDDLDLILSDIMMPKMDGYALLERLKKHPDWRQKPVVMLTARANEEDKLQALRLGVDDYLLKPFSAEELLARVANRINNYRQRQLFLQKEKAAVAVRFEAVESADQRWLQELEKTALTALEKKLNLTADYLAAELHVSNSQLYRRIKSLTGLTTKKYILEIKLQKARHLFENKAFGTIAEVSYACGFNTPGYFTTLYKKHFGRKPASYF